MSSKRKWMAELWVMLALFGGSLFVMGWLVGVATAAPPQVCQGGATLVDEVRGITFTLPPRCFNIHPVYIPRANPCTLEDPCVAVGRRWAR